MGFVHKAEVRLETVEHRGVGVEKGTIRLEQRLERRLPPGEFELGGDLRIGHVSRCQIVEQRVELEVAKGAAQLGALLQVVQHIRFRSEGRESFGEDMDRQVDELGFARHRTERLVEEFQVLCHLLVGHLHVGDTDRYLRRGPGSDKPLPEDSLLLDVLQALVDVPDVHSGTHILPSEFLEPPTIRRRHLWRVLAGGCCGDELAERAVEDHRKEPVEGVADINEQAKVDTEFVDRLERTHARTGDEIARTLD